MNRKSVIGIVFLSILIGSVVFNSINVSGYSIVIEETGGAGAELSVSGYEYFWRSFYSTYTDRFYVLYSYLGTGWAFDEIYYSSSPDGIMWTNGTNFPTGDPEMQLGREMDFYVTPDGKDIYYVFEQENDADDMWWGMNSINLTTGLIEANVSAIEIMAGVYQAGGHGQWGSKKVDDEYSIVADSEGYVYIGVEATWGASQYTYIVIKSNAPNSFNFEDFGWSKGIETEYIANGHANPGNDKWGGTLFMMDNLEDVGIVFIHTLNFGVHELHHSMYYDNSTNDWVHIGGTIFNDDEGGDWADNSWTIGYGNDTAVLFKQHESNPDFFIGLEAVFLNMDTYEWENQTQISFDVAGDAGATVFLPLASILDSNGAINFIWSINANDTIWYRRMYPNGTLEDIGILESNLPYPISNTQFTSYPKAQSPMGVAWLINEGQLNISDFAGDYILHNYLTFLEDDWEIPYAHLNTTLYNDDGSINDGWLFEGEIYTFESYFFGADIFRLNFTDGQHEILLSFVNETGQMDVYSNERLVIGDIYTNYTLYPDGTQKATWRFIPDIDIVDYENSLVYYYIYNNTFGGSGTVALTGITFNIYNLGGLTYYTFVGDGGRTAYGSAFDLHAMDGNISSSAKAEQIFRKLQHISFLVEIDMGNEWDAGIGAFDIDAGVGYVDIGLDYRLNATWIDGFKIRLYVFDADVGHHLGGNDQDWVLWSVDFYNYLPSSGTQQNLRTQYIYSNHWGYERRNFSPDRYDNRTSSQLWIDLWFDRTNASTTIATQTNAYYRGMKEQGSAWWFGYGVFTPMIGDYDNAKFLDDLYDEGGNVTNVQKFDLMRFYIEVGKVNITDGNDEMWRISAVEDFHRELAIDRMEGIDEPTFVETKIIDMPQTGFINAIKSAINGLSKLIWGGAFQFIKLLMGAVGGLMDAIGLGAWWLSFSTMLDRLATASINLMEELQVALISAVSLIEQIFRLITTGMTKFISFMTTTISSVINWYTYIVQMFTGGGIFSLDIWTSLSMEDFVYLGIHLLPIFWVNRLSKSDDMMSTIQGDIGFMITLTTGLINFLVTVIMLAVTLLNFLIGLLPI